MIKELAQDLVVFVVVSACTGALVLKNKAVTCGGSKAPQVQVSKAQ